ncbi:MAG TPA: phosphatase PAP2 family protein [Rhodanobacteraceae bacterium]|nr:phosphatase PAP2 family protein [Rhodanobacteraceae bacterium]
MSIEAQNDWRSQLLTRLRSRWLLKTIGIAVYITAFMCTYFALLNHPQSAVTVMPLQPLDHWIGFEPWAVVPYASLWLYIGVVPSLLWLRRDEMGRYLAAVTLLSLAGCGIFYFWPTAVPAFPLDWSAWPLVTWLKSTDASGNACPSLHVAFSVLTAIWLHWLLRRTGAPRWLHGFNVVWCVLIVWSTMATRQHVALDVEVGALLGGLLALVCLYFRPVPVRQPDVCG